MAGSALPVGLSSQITVHQLTDTEIRQIMRDCAAESERILRSLEGNEGVAARVRSAQASLANAQVQAWRGVGDAAKVGVGDAFDAAASMGSKFDLEIFSKVGLTPYFWEQSVLAQSRQGIKNYLARQEFNYTLSQRVYRNQALSQNQVSRVVNTGLALGKSAREIAQDVKRFIDPRTPGGASYAAMRLGRTEVQNALHTANVKGYQEKPWVESVTWHLSGSHGRPDQCNEYATQRTFKGGGAGEWLPSDVPAKPHPNCLCYTSPNADLDKFVKDFKAGKFNDYIDDKIGCSVA